MADVEIPSPGRGIQAGTGRNVQQRHGTQLTMWRITGLACPSSFVSWDEVADDTIYGHIC